MAVAGSNIEKVKSILAHSVENAKPLLKQLHPTDLATILEDISPESRMLLFRMLPVETASDALSEMDEDANPEELLLGISPQRAAKIIERSYSAPFLAHFKSFSKPAPLRICCRAETAILSVEPLKYFCSILPSRKSRCSSCREGNFFN